VPLARHREGCPEWLPSLPEEMRLDHSAASRRFCSGLNATASTRCAHRRATPTATISGRSSTRCWRARAREEPIARRRRGADRVSARRRRRRRAVGTTPSPAFTLRHASHCTRRASCSARKAEAIRSPGGRHPPCRRRGTKPRAAAPAGSKTRGEVSTGQNRPGQMAQPS
jgi:hypothetical protein